MFRVAFGSRCGALVSRKGLLSYNPNRIDNAERALTILRRGSASKTPSQEVQVEKKIPLGVNSTSLGLEPEVTGAGDDPLKWRKFFWKYAGAVLLFGVAFTGLNRYKEQLISAKKEKERQKQARTWPIAGNQTSTGSNDLLETSTSANVASEDATIPASEVSQSTETEGRPQFLPRLISVNEVVLNEREELELRELELAAKLREISVNEDRTWSEKDAADVQRQLDSVRTALEGMR